MVIKQFLYCPGVDFFDGPIEDSMKPNKVTKKVESIKSGPIMIGYIFMGILTI